MITVFTDELTKSSSELRDHPESQPALTAPSLHSNCQVFTLDSIRQNVLNQIEATLRIGRDWLEAKEKYTRRKEFTKFQAEQPITPAEGRKAMKVYEQFGNDWEQERLLIVNGVVSLYTLCHPKFAEVVRQLREAANLTKEFVKNLVKEVRDAAKVERKKKPLTDPARSGWRQDPSGGGRHYQLPPMYNEEAAMKVEAMAQERGVRAITVVEEAVTAYTEQPTINELKRLSHQEEMQSAVTEMRDEHIRMQREIIELKQLVQTPKPVERKFSSWTEFADSVNCNRSVLLGTVKLWSHPERQALATLLADHLSEDQNNLDQVAWVLEKLLHRRSVDGGILPRQTSFALSKLSFCVSKISGPDNRRRHPSDWTK